MASTHITKRRTRAGSARSIRSLENDQAWKRASGTRLSVRNRVLWTRDLPTPDPVDNSDDFLADDDFEEPILDQKLPQAQPDRVGESFTPEDDQADIPPPSSEDTKPVTKTEAPVAPTEHQETPPHKSVPQDHPAHLPEALPAVHQQISSPQDKSILSSHVVPAAQHPQRAAQQQSAQHQQLAALPPTSPAPVSHQETSSTPVNYQQVSAQQQSIQHHKPAAAPAYQPQTAAQQEGAQAAQPATLPVSHSKQESVRPAIVPVISPHQNTAQLANFPVTASDQQIAPQTKPAPTTSEAKHTEQPSAYPENNSAQASLETSQPLQVDKAHQSQGQASQQNLQNGHSDVGTTSASTGTSAKETAAVSKDGSLKLLPGNASSDSSKALPVGPGAKSLAVQDHSAPSNAQMSGMLDQKSTALRSSRISLPILAAVVVPAAIILVLLALLLIRMMSRRRKENKPAQMIGRPRRGTSSTINSMAEVVSTPAVQSFAVAEKELNLREDANAPWAAVHDEFEHGGHPTGASRLSYDTPRPMVAVPPFAFSAQPPEAISPPNSNPRQPLTDMIDPDMAVDPGMPVEGGVPCQKSCVVMQSFIPSASDELIIGLGDRVIVRLLFDDGWCWADNLDYKKHMIPGQPEPSQSGVVPQECLSGLLETPELATQVEALATPNESVSGEDSFDKADWDADRKQSSPSHMSLCAPKRPQRRSSLFIDREVQLLSELDNALGFAVSSKQS